MKLDETLLKNEEKVVFMLRSLYRSFGYSRFKMSKFEEYDLYGRNKEFLVSDGVITFTDTNGKLMALKPDVTLSIVKNTVDKSGEVKRVYYDENVYRISDKTHQYKEIMQTGLEAIGDLTPYHLFEVLSLAAKSLSVISGECVLAVSHLGVISAILDGVTGEREALLRALEEKNPHELAACAAAMELPQDKTALLEALVGAFGEPARVIGALREKTSDAAILAALDELESVISLCDKVEGVRLVVDLSLIGDVNYYNGLIFRGYVKGIPAGVVSGGQYDKLMAKMGKTSRAIGFAVYLDQLERLEKEEDFDVDVLLLINKDLPAARIAARARAITASGQSVAVEATVPEKLRYRTLVDLAEEETK